MSDADKLKATEALLADALDHARELERELAAAQSACVTAQHVRLDHRAHLRITWELLRTMSRFDVEHVLGRVLPLIYEAAAPSRHSYNVGTTIKWVTAVHSRMVDPLRETFDQFLARCPELLDRDLVNR